MGLVSIGGIICTLSLSTETYEAFLVILWEGNCNLDLNTFMQKDT